MTMKRGVLVLLAMCSLVSAMVPRERRARQTEAEAAPVNVKERCAYNTPCAWTVYQSETRVKELTINNTYCICDDDLECQVDEDDIKSTSYVLRCRAPGSKLENSES